MPSSITGRKESCWARLKRWISSTKSSVPCRMRAAAAGRLEDLLEIGDAGEDRRDLLEMRGRSHAPAAARPWSCRCRAAPRRSASRASRSAACRVSAPSGRAGGPGRRPRPASRPQPVGQRPGRGAVEAGGGEEIGHRHLVGPGIPRPSGAAESLVSRPERTPLRRPSQRQMRDGGDGPSGRPNRDRLRQRRT